MTDELCVICNDRPAHGAYACVHCAIDRPRQLLTEITDMLQAAIDVAQRQARRGGGGGGSGKPGSEIPLDLGATARLDAVRTALTTWARHVAEERGVEAPEGGAEPILAAARWLADHLEWLRHTRAVDEWLRDVEACARIIRGIAEPGGQHRVIVGLCDCGKTLYAPTGRQVVTCRNCDLQWDVDESRDALRGHLGERLVTAAEAAHLGAYLDTERTSEQVRKLVNKWASRGRLEERGLNGGDPTYRFGDIAALIATSPRRVAAITPA